MLLLEAGRVVPVARLVEATWEKDPPVTASHQVRKAVADLRRRIPTGTEVIATDGPGYRVVVADDQVDLLEFDALTRAAGQALREGGRSAAAEALRAALALWRGSVLSGTGGPVIEAAATALEERRLAAAEQFFDLCLALGESGELISGLRALITQHPLRETLRGQLMLALYRSGRQAEALKEYGEVRELLVDELGIDPGPRLAKLYEAILRDSPELAAPERPAPVAVAPVRPVPEPAAPAEPLPEPAVPVTVPSEGGAPEAPSRTEADREGRPERAPGRRTPRAPCRTTCPTSPAVPRSSPSSSTTCRTRAGAASGTPGSWPSTAWAAWARPPWPCAPRTGWPAGIPTGSSTSTCTDSPRAASP